MELLSPDGNSIKMEPGTGETVGDERPNTNIDVDHRDVKKEYLNYSEGIDQKAGKKFDKMISQIENLSLQSEALLLY